MLRLRYAVLIVAGASFIAPVFPQAYPVKPIQVISSASVGSPGDVALRVIGAKMGASLGQPVVVDVRLGAAGTIAGSAVSRAAPDGYTLLFAPSGNLVMSRFLVKDIPYDTLKDFTPVSLAVSAPQFIAVHGSVPVSSVKELIDYARRNPGKLEYGTTGVGGSQHMVMESFKLFNGIDLLHVPYAQKNVSQLLNDFLTGRIPVFVTAYANIAPYVSSAKVKVLVVVDDRRSKLLPAVPSMKELFPGYHSIVTWWAFFGPPGLPTPAASRLSSEIHKALQDPQSAAKLEELGLAIIASTPGELSGTIRSDIDNVGKLVAALGLKPE